MDVIFYAQLNRANFDSNAGVNLFNDNVYVKIKLFIQIKME
jgi:hypothetical protein